MRTTERPTLRDVARHAGVSTMTVSNVVNARPGKVSPATAARVMASIELIGYVPNRQARALASQSSGLVALIYPPITPNRVSTSPGCADLICALETALKAEGRSLMIRSATDVPAAILELRSWGIDGAVVLGIPPTPGISFKVPIIWVGRPPSPTSETSTWRQAIIAQAESIVTSMAGLVAAGTCDQVETPPLAV